MIRIEHLQFGYGDGDDLLRIDDLALDARESMLVIGPSGCGKTTLLHLMAGILAPRRGHVFVNDEDIAKLTSAARDRFRGRNIGIVLQQFHLLPTLTSIQNLLIAQSIAGLPVERD